MAGRTIELTAADGHRFEAYRADPQGKPRGGVVVVQEAFGLNAHIRRVADGYAAQGYVAVAPAMFDRVERGVDLPYDPSVFPKVMELIGKISVDQSMADVAAAVAEASAGGKVGIVGYCMGGLMSWLAAGKVSGLSAAVGYYGGRISENLDVSPRIPVMLHFGEKDAHIPLTEVRKITARYPKIPVHVYAADHGFNCDDRDAYNKPAAELALRRTLEFFREHIG